MKPIVTVYRQSDTGLWAASGPTPDDPVNHIILTGESAAEVMKGLEGKLSPHAEIRVTRPLRYAARGFA